MKKWQTKKTRKFAGHIFDRSYHFASKADAKHFADKSRNLGYQCRVIGHVGAWTVYRRK